MQLYRELSLGGGRLIREFLLQNGVRCVSTNSYNSSGVSRSPVDFEALSGFCTVALDVISALL